MSEMPAALFVLAGVLSLDQAVKRAEQHHPQLRQARGATATAAAQADLARAPLLPQLVGNGSYQRTTANFVLKPGSVPPQIASSSTATFDTYNFFNLSATASLLLFDTGATLNGYRAQRALADAQEATERLTRDDVVLGARTAYFNAWATRALVDVARETLTNQERHLAQIQGYVKTGTRPAIDLAQVRADYATAEVQLINAQNNYEIAKAQLAQAMGDDGPARFEIGNDALPPVADEDGPGERLLDEALRARPDFAALERQLRAQELLLSQARGGYGPQLVVSSTASAAGVEVSDLTPNWNVLVTLTWPLFSGLGTRAQVQQADATLSTLVARRDGLRQQASVEVETARLRVRAAKAAGVAAKDALANARERFKLAEGRYRAGIGSVIELGDAQVGLTNASAQLVQAEYGLSTARALLLRALGRR
jgi:outer membrane protein